MTHTRKHNIISGRFHLENGLPQVEYNATANVANVLEAKIFLLMDQDVVKYEGKDQRDDRSALLISGCRCE